MCTLYDSFLETIDASLSLNGRLITNPHMNLIIALMTKTKENACSQVVRKLRTQNLKPGFRLYDGNKLGCFFFNQ